MFAVGRQYSAGGTTQAALTIVEIAATTMDNVDAIMVACSRPCTGKMNYEKKLTCAAKLEADV